MSVKQARSPTPFGRRRPPRPWLQPSARRRRPVSQPAQCDHPADEAARDSFGRAAGLRTAAPLAAPSAWRARSYVK